jgi:hypothetical protein
MEPADRQSPRWLAPSAGTFLVVLGSCQLVYSTLAVALLIGVRFLQVLLNLFAELVSLKPNTTSGRNVHDTGDPIADLATMVASLGLMLATCALIAGILTLRSHRLATYFAAISTAFALTLAWCHMVVLWYGFAMLYVAVGLVLAILSIRLLRRGTPDSA